jgi:HEAT repeat protein
LWLKPPIGIPGRWAFIFLGVIFFALNECVFCIQGGFLFAANRLRWRLWGKPDVFVPGLRGLVMPRSRPIPDMPMAEVSPALPQTPLESAVAELLLDLVQGDFRQRWEVARQLPQYGEAAIAALVTLLQDEDLDWELRWFGARILGDFQAPEVIPTLMQLLDQTPESDVLGAVAAALGNFGAAGVAALTHCLERPEQRSQAVQVLAQMGHPATLEPLLTVVDDGDAGIRGMAITALAQFRDDRLLSLLLAALQDDAPTVRQEAVTSLGRYPDIPRSTLVRAIAPRLQDPVLAVSQAAAITLGRLGTAAAISHLAQTLRTTRTPEPLKITAVQALGWVETETAFNALVAAWGAVGTAVQLQMITILGGLVPPSLRQQSQEVLQIWLKELLELPAATAQKQAIALALGHLQAQSARPLLAQLTADANEQVRLHGEAALRLLAGEQGE